MTLITAENPIGYSFKFQLDPLPARGGVRRTSNWYWLRIPEIYTMA